MNRNVFVKWKQNILKYMKENPEDHDVKLISDFFFKKFKSGKYYTNSLDQKYSHPLRIADLILEAYFGEGDDLLLCSVRNSLKIISFALLVIHCVDTMIYEIENKFKSNELRFLVPRVSLSGRSFDDDIDISELDFKLELVHQTSNGYRNISVSFVIYWDNYGGDDLIIKNIDNYPSMLDAPIEVWYKSHGTTRIKHPRLAELPMIVKTMMDELIEDFNKM